MVAWLSEWGLLLCVLVSSVALMLAALALSRVKQQAEEVQKLNQKISRDLALANSGSIGMGQRLMAMEKRLREQPAEVQAQGVEEDDEFRAYTQAVQLFKLGLSSEEVSQRCGLSRAESSLMEMMYKANR